jgi:DNA-binding XRE family transcriptional regulator
VNTSGDSDDTTAGQPMAGALIKRWRQARGLTQRQLATASGVSLGTLRDLEQGRTIRPHWKLVAQLAPEQGQYPDPDPDTGSGTGSARVRIALLGPLTAWRGETRIALGSVRQRAVLALLALHLGVGLHRDAIIDVLWGDRPPSSAVPQVQGYICQLRRLLGAGCPGAGRHPSESSRRGAGLVKTDGASYRLHAREEELDLAGGRAARRSPTR